ncbi:hypothetical protein [Sinorhizobium fredii]|uniref:hypothetical protein n=1 Tax=Rhizobium fredii TaxID=380 RepID=UPI0013046518|nr:hypothetical protein [Sinorhizobium fredii]
MTEAKASGHALEIGSRTEGRNNLSSGRNRFSRSAKAPVKTQPNPRKSRQFKAFRPLRSFLRRNPTAELHTALAACILTPGERAAAHADLDKLFAEQTALDRALDAAAAEKGAPE